jgi:chloride channel 7
LFFFKTKLLTHNSRPSIGIPEIKAYLNGTNFPRLLRLKTLIVKAVGVTLAVSGGLAVGKEGPLIHSGSVIAANLSHLPKLAPRFGRVFKRFRNDQAKRDFVSCGAASGVAAAFGAPIGGILFSFEEASSFWSLQLTWRAFFAAMVATFTLNAFLSGADGDWLAINKPGLITFGGFVSHAYRLWELPFFALLGVFGGLCGALFCAVNVRISHWRRDFYRRRQPLRIVEALLVALLTAGVSFWLPAFFPCRDVPRDDNAASYRRYTCAAGQFNDMATTIFATSELAIKSFFHTTANYSFSVLGIYGVTMFLLANITYGIAVPSGKNNLV